MSEEEKKAINNMKIFARVHQDMTVVTAEDMDIVLNLVEKQQAEIEQNNKVVDKRNEENLELVQMCLKKDKIIDLLAYSLADYVMYYEYNKCRNPEMIKAKAEEQKQYFEKKVNSSEQN